MTIPREMRDRIYYFTFADYCIPAPAAKDESCDPLALNNTGLLATCRQIRDEAFSSYYSLIKIDIGVDLCEELLSKLPPSARSCLTKVHICSYHSGNFFIEQELHKVQGRMNQIGLQRDVCMSAFWASSGDVKWASNMPEDFNYVDGPCCMRKFFSLSLESMVTNKGSHR